MKKLLTLLLIISFYCNSAEPVEKSIHHKLAVSWSNALDLDHAKDLPSIPGGVNLKDLHIKVLTDLLDIQQNKYADHIINKHSEICKDYIANSILKLPVRVYARINLAILQTFLAFRSVSDITIDAYVSQARSHSIIAFALARKSGIWQRAQEKMIKDNLKNFKNSGLTFFFKEITINEIDLMEAKLAADPELQFRLY